MHMNVIFAVVEMLKFGMVLMKLRSTTVELLFLYMTVNSGVVVTGSLV